MTRLGSAVATAVRFGLGGRVGATGPRPTGELVLYEFEACPFCRKVREALVWLDLDVTMRPCPPGGTRFGPGGSRRSRSWSTTGSSSASRRRSCATSSTATATATCRWPCGSGR
ncbi:glutathione S-transferase N-terminal domain-containing protein [Nannocystis pusilla]|uniref:Glutathione S-transferase N-terminal domain-containing protein n=1 Tax=Nannocystis pusilla TaxID=889268 RepID=A0A9X3EY99_9BACT|nr:glutathione S-transferase N-terminal domain-containing protein [Nannocystis pusilla]MCY1012286.1 glutathione S-transferase N-terminal domain-containing protein [Nannocystis pusilla]